MQRYNRDQGNKDYNQLDRIVVHVGQSAMVMPTVDILNRLLVRRHQKVSDYEIVVPELLLKQEQKTKPCSM